MAALLAGDVGGTKVYLRAFNVESGDIIAEQRYLSAHFPSLISLVQSFQKEYGILSCQMACLGLPGPVNGRKVQLTNLPWLVDAQQLEDACQIHSVFIINDFSAAAYGIDELEDTDILTLQTGQYDNSGNRLVVGAGTGLGVSPVMNCSGEFIPQSSEGGHLDFAPLNKNQCDLLIWLQKKWHHVSYERILSGEGIVTLYAFFSVLAAHKNNHKNMTASKVYDLALQGDKVALRTLDTFVEVYGAYIGNLALIWRSTAGIYIAGGIASKIQYWMEKPLFVNALLDKGRMAQQVKNQPVYLVKNGKLGLLGSVAYVKIAYKEKFNEVLL